MGRVYAMNVTPLFTNLKVEKNLAYKSQNMYTL